MEDIIETRATVVVGRKWDNPNITISVTNEEIGIQMSLDDFVHALALEVGNPTLLVTTGALKRRLNQAAEIVVRGMKLETASVI